VRRGAFDLHCRICVWPNQCHRHVSRQGFTRQYSFFLGMTEKRKIVAVNVSCPFRA